MEKRILVIAERVPFPSDNGGKLRTANVLKQLSKYYVVDFVVYSQDPVNEAQIKSMEEYCDNLYLFSEGYPSSLKHIKYLVQGKSGIACAVYSSNMQGNIISLVKKCNYHFIWVERLFCMPYLDFLLDKTRKHIPIILNMHDVDSEAVKYFSKVDTNKIKRLYYAVEYARVRRLEKESLANVDRIIACSERDKQVYIEMLPFEQDKWLVANNGVDLTVAKRCKPIERNWNKVLFVGGLDNPCNREGIIWCLENVWDRVIKINPEAVLTIAGSGKSTEQIKQLISHKKNVEFLGYVDDVDSLYLQSGCIIVPLHSGSGTRLKIVEAFSFKTPVVSTSIGAEGLPVENGKEIVIADEPKCFADGILRIMRSKENTFAMTMKAYDIAKNYYDWNIIMKNTITKIESAL